MPIPPSPVRRSRLAPRDVPVDPQLFSCPTGAIVTYTPTTFPPNTIIDDPFCVFVNDLGCCSGSVPTSGFSDLSHLDVGTLGFCITGGVMEITPVTLPDGFSWNDDGTICAPVCLIFAYIASACCPPDEFLPNYVVLTQIDLSGALGVYAGTYILRSFLDITTHEITGWFEHFIMPSGAVQHITLSCRPSFEGGWELLIGQTGMEPGRNCSQFTIPEVYFYNVSPSSSPPNPTLDFLQLYPGPPTFALCQPLHFQACSPLTYTGSICSDPLPGYAYPANMTDASTAPLNSQMYFRLDQFDPGAGVTDVYPTADGGVFYGYPDLQLQLFGSTSASDCCFLNAGIDSGDLIPFDQAIRLSWNGYYWVGPGTVHNAFSGFNRTENFALYYGFFFESFLAQPPDYSNLVPVGDGIWRAGLEKFITNATFPGSTLWTSVWSVSASPFTLKWKNVSSTNDGPDPTIYAIVTIAPDQMTGSGPILTPPPPGVPPPPIPGQYIKGGELQFVPAKPDGVIFGEPFSKVNPEGCCGTRSPSGSGGGGPCPNGCQCCPSNGGIAAAFITTSEGQFGFNGSWAKEGSEFVATVNSGPIPWSFDGSSGTFTVQMTAVWVCDDPTHFPGGAVAITLVIAGMSPIEPVFLLSACESPQVLDIWSQVSSFFPGFGITALELSY
jgi:hypothetical protein